MKYDKKKEKDFKHIKNTFLKEHLSDPTRKIEVEVGDIKQSSFFPQFKTKHWDNEVNFSVRLKSDGNSKETYSKKDGLIEKKKGKRKARFYTKDSIDEDGAFEFEVELSAKPKSNVIEFTTKSKGLDFFYQPLSLEEEEKNTLHSPERAEKVKGSYAVYHKEKSGDYSRMGGKNYRAGKAFHIYRPFVVDKKGNKVWCELHIYENKELLTITIPQDFLDTAIYPIIIDPTFGYTTNGATSGYANNNYLFGSTFTNTDNGTVSSIVYVVQYKTGYATQTFYAALYDSSGDLVGYTSEDTESKVGAYWFTQGLLKNKSLAVSAQEYYICYISKIDKASFLHYDIGDTNQGPYYYVGSFPTTPPSNLGNIGNIGYTNWKHSMYVIYDNITLSISVDDTITYEDEFQQVVSPHSYLTTVDVVIDRTREIALSEIVLTKKYNYTPILYDTYYGSVYNQGQIGRAHV